MQVCIRDLSGNTCTLELSGEASVTEALRALPHDVFGSSSRVKLFHKGVALRKSQVLGDLELKPSEFLTAVGVKGRKRKKPEGCPKPQEKGGDDRIDIWKDIHSELIQSQVVQEIDDVSSVASAAGGVVGHTSIPHVSSLVGALEVTCRQAKHYRLPAALQRLSAGFRSLTVLHRFLTNNHIQTTWLVIRDALRRLCQDDTFGDEDVLHIAEIGCHLVAVRQGVSSSRQQKDGTNRNSAESSDGNSPLLEMETVREIMGRGGIGIRDGSGTILEGDLKNLIIDFVNPFKNRVNQRETDINMPRDSQRTGGIGKQRIQLFEDRLLQAVKHLHDEFMSGDTAFSTYSCRSINDKDIPSDDWHPEFDLDSITVRDAIQALEHCKAKKEKNTSNADLQDPIPRLLCRSVTCKSCAKMNPTELLKHLQQQTWYQDQAVHTEHIPSKPPSFCSLECGLSPPVTKAVNQSGIKKFFSHQAHAIGSLLSGKNVAIATSTASGKSLCYNVPVLEILTKEPDACALFIFPTKALAQDQRRALSQFCTAAFGSCAPPIEVYDGDTCFESRGDIRSRVQLLITNPDMLHLSILPVHDSFARFLSRLKVVVIDEGHAYKGVFGCHTAMVLRRLRRVCKKKHNVEPRFVMTSATIANPEEHMKQLVGVDSAEVIVADGSPQGAKKFVLWNPPLYYSKRLEDKAPAKMSKRQIQDQERYHKREANQIRGRGSQLSEARGMTESEWIQAIAISKKRGLVENELEETPADISSTQTEYVSLDQSQPHPEPRASANAQAAALNTVDVQHHTKQRPVIMKGSMASKTASRLSEEVESCLPGKEWKSRSGTTGITDDKRRGSPMVEMSLMLAECMQHGLRTIAFCMSRKLCELVMAYTQEVLQSQAPNLVHCISVYRAGYTPEERREIESNLFKGTLRAVAATNALELGIDVGSLDVTLHLGYPGSSASLWQQAGRAGRRGQTSLSVYVAFDGPLDQYFMQHPRQLFGRPIERVQVDAANSGILKEHILCAAHEIPMEKNDEKFFGDKLGSEVKYLMEEGLLCRPPHCGPACGIWKYSGRVVNPASQVSLRSIDPERYIIYDAGTEGRILEEIEESKVFFQIYEGAVYMFQGQTYLCTKMDLAKKTAFVRAANLKYYTILRDFTVVHVAGSSVAYPTKEYKEAYPATSAICADALVTLRFLGFFRVWRGSEITFDSVDLFLPDVQFETQAVYVRVPHSLRAQVRDAGLEWQPGLHGANHALLNVLPLFVMCGEGDTQTECAHPYDTKYRPERLLLFDNHPGGMGIASTARPLFGVLLEKAYELVRDCPCGLDQGCPGCVQHGRCGEYNTFLCRNAAELILKGVLEAEGCNVD